MIGKTVPPRIWIRFASAGNAARRLLLSATLLLLAGLLTAHADGLARDFPPTPPPPKPVVLPTPVVHALPNGLKVMVIERHSLPLLTLRLVVKCGAEADPEGFPGVAQLVAAMLDQGTSERSAQQIAEAIDQVGGTIRTRAEWDDSFAALTVLTDHTQLAFDLLADMVIRPTFPREEIDRRRKQTLSALEVLRGDPDYTADKVFHQLVFAGTPYGRPLDGTEESLGRITRRDLVEFHTLYYRPANCVLALVGDISAPDALQLADKYFGAWKGERGRPAKLGVVARRGPRRLVVIDKPDAVQTEIRVGNLAIRRDSPDYYALTVANQILGGPATNRLFKSLRSRQALAYGASSDLICNRTLGSWVAKTSTRTSGTVKTLESVLEQIERLHDHAISGSELRTAQEYLIGHMALEFESSDDIAVQVLELVVHDLPLDYWNRYPKEIRALRTADVLTATRRYLNPQDNVIVLVGDARGFSGELKRFGALQVIPLTELDFASPTLERTAGKAGDE